MVGGCHACAQTIFEFFQILQLRQQTIQLILNVGTQQKRLHTEKQTSSEQRAHGSACGRCMSFASLEFRCHSVLHADSSEHG
jgi:hypothetical protein